MLEEWGRGREVRKTWDGQAELGENTPQDPAAEAQCARL